jgi:hypothetical protein
VQLGVDPERAVVLADVDSTAAEVLDCLDGTREVSEVLSHAVSRGCDPGGARRLLDLLTFHDVLDDAAADRRPLTRLDPVERDRLGPDLASLSLAGGQVDGGARIVQQRRRTAVTVHGAGRIGAAVASLLAASGIGHVQIVDAAPTRHADTGPGGLDAEAVGLPREAAARSALQRLTPQVRTQLPAGRTRPDVAVLAPVTAIAPGLTDELLRAGVPHLSAGVRERTGVVGPLVVPGRSACLRCLDLHRTDRDPAWPHVAAQLAGAAGSAVQPCDTVLATAVASQAALQVLLLVDGEASPPSLDGTLEISLDDGRTRRRSWRPHHACGCRWEDTRTA